MAYNIKYYTTFNDSNGTAFTVNLKKNNYTGSTTIITSTDVSPIIINYRGGKDEFNTVQGSECIFNFYSRLQDSSVFDEVLTSNYRDWILEVKTGSTVYWTGYVNLEDMYKPLTKPNYPISISASDGLNELKNISFPSTQVTGETLMIKVIKTCLDQIGFVLDYQIQCNTYESNLMTSTQFLFEKVKVNTYRFKDVKNGRTVYSNCYDVLNYCLKGFNCQITQQNGKYVITNQSEENSKRWSINYTALTGSSATYNRNVDITNTTKLHLGSDELSKVRPIKSFELTFRNKRLNNLSVIANSTFNSGISNWTNGGSPNNFYQYFWDSTSKRLKVNEPPLGSPNTTKYFTSDAFTITKIGEDTITVSVDAELIQPTFSVGSTNPKLMIKIIYPDSSSYDSYDFQMDVGIKNYSFNYVIPSTGSYQVRIYIKPDPYTTYTYWGVYFDNINGFIKYESDAVTTDKLYYITNTGVTATQISNLEETIFFADSPDLNDVGAMKVSTNLTTSWNTYGNTEAKPLVHIYGNQKLNEFRSFKDYVRMKLKGVVKYNNTLTINSKKYSITNYSNDVKNNNIEIELSEFFDTNTTGILFEQYVLNTVDGKESTASSNDSSASILGTVNAIPKFTTSSSIGDSQLKDDGTKVSIGGTPSTGKFEVIAGLAAIVARQTSTTSYTGLRLMNDQNSTSRSLEIDYSGSAYASSLLTGGVSGEAASITTTGAYPLMLGTNNIARIVINSSGNVGIGNDSPSEKLHVTGNILASGEVTAYSDLRLKQNINEYSKGLEVINKLKPVTYSMKNDNSNTIQLGLIAQDVNNVEPLLVINTGDYLSLNYQKLTVNLINAVNELSNKVIELENKLNEKPKRVNKK